MMKRNASRNVILGIAATLGLVAMVLAMTGRPDGRTILDEDVLRESRGLNPNGLPYSVSCNSLNLADEENNVLCSDPDRFCFYCESPMATYVHIVSGGYGGYDALLTENGGCGRMVVGQCMGTYCDFLAYSSSDCVHDTKAWVQ